MEGIGSDVILFVGTAIAGGAGLIWFAARSLRASNAQRQRQQPPRAANAANDAAQSAAEAARRAAAEMREARERDQERRRREAAASAASPAAAPASSAESSASSSAAPMIIIKLVERGRARDVPLRASDSCAQLVQRHLSVAANERVRLFSRGRELTPTDTLLDGQQVLVQRSDAAAADAQPPQAAFDAVSPLSQALQNLIEHGVGGMRLPEILLGVVWLIFLFWPHFFDTLTLGLLSILTVAATVLRSLAQQHR